MKVAIVGNGRTWEKAPFEDSKYKIYSANRGLYSLPRIDILFDMHDWTRSDYLPDYYEDLKKTELSVVKPANDKNIKNCIVFPKKKAQSIFGSVFGSSSQYMIAYAYMEGATEIKIYGIDDHYLTKNNYHLSWYYMLGVLRGMKVDVYYDGWSISSAFYGYGNLKHKNVNADYKNKVLKKGK